LMFSPPMFSPSDNWTFELFDPHLFGPCKFIQELFIHFLGQVD
jgi:hypothetical protein